MRQIMTGILALAISGLFLCSGCHSEISGAGADTKAKYEWGTLKAELNYPIETTFMAAKKAAEELELTVILDQHDEVAGLIMARDAQEEKVKIKLEALPMSRTILTIHVGMFGDKNKSNVIFNQVVKNISKEG